MRIRRWSPVGYDRARVDGNPPGRTISGRGRQRAALRGDGGSGASGAPRFVRRALSGRSDHARHDGPRAAKVDRHDVGHAFDGYALLWRRAVCGLRFVRALLKSADDDDCCALADGVRDIRGLVSPDGHTQEEGFPDVFPFPSLSVSTASGVRDREIRDRPARLSVSEFRIGSSSTLDRHRCISHGLSPLVSVGEAATS